MFVCAHVIFSGCRCGYASRRLLFCSRSGVVVFRPCSAINSCIKPDAPFTVTPSCSHAFNRLMPRRSMCCMPLVSRIRFWWLRMACVPSRFRRPTAGPESRPTIFSSTFLSLCSIVVIRIKTFGLWETVVCAARSVLHNLGQAQKVA